MKALYGRKPCPEFGPTRAESCPAKDGRRWAVPKDGQSADRPREANVQVGRGRGADPGQHPQALSMVEGLKYGRTEARETNRSAQSRIRLSMPPCRTCPKSWPIWCDCNGLPAAAGGIVHDPRRWTWTAPPTFGPTGPKSHKTQHHGKERIIYIGPQAQGVLLRYLARDAAAYCFRPCDSEAKRLAARHAARKTPLSCGNKPGTNRKAKPKRKAGDGYSVTPTAEPSIVLVTWHSPSGIVGAEGIAVVGQAACRVATVAGRSSLGAEPVAAHRGYGNSQRVRTGSRANCAWTFASQYHASLRRARYAEGYRGRAADWLRFRVCGDGCTKADSVSDCSN